jgi:hypothetical protein
VFNGVTQFLKVETLDLSSTDAVTVFAGVRKLSDVATGFLCELSDSIDVNQGVFYVACPGANGSRKYSAAFKGTISSLAQVFSGYDAPTTNILTGIGDISENVAKLRINSEVVSVNNSDQGSGNYGSYPLYIGMRAGTSLPFNGELTRLTIVGKLLETPTNQRIERIIANQMRQVI